jgi:two-component system NtrC family sensor kinase
MAHQTMSSRVTSSGGRAALSEPRSPETATRALLSLLARSTRPGELLPRLHQHALEVTGGTCSLLLEHNPRNGALQPTSGFGLVELRPERWSPGAAEATLVGGLFAGNVPRLVTDAAREMPELAGRLGTESALLLPLTHDRQRVGLLAIGFADASARQYDEEAAAEVVDAVLAALELFRLRRNEEVQRELQQLISEVSAALSTALNLGEGLSIFCDRANRLFGADRTAVWLHERRSRHLVLKASSDGSRGTDDTSVAVEDALAPAAVALRSARAELQLRGGDEVVSTLTVPLRGCRRALGTIVFEGVRVETGGELDVLHRADELGAQLAGAIENLQLLDDVVRSRRELENTFDSIADLVVVSDQQGTIVNANLAFADRLGRPRDELLDRPLTECIGPDLAAWLASPERSIGLSGEPAATLEVVDPVLNGPFLVTVTDLLDHDRNRSGRVLVARDLTPQAKLEAEKEQLRRRLMQSEKLAALGQFVAGIAHELNNPLQGVLGHLELLKATGAFPRQLRREVQTIYREADRAAKIVRNLLVFAGSRPLTRRRVSLTGVLQKVLVLRQDALRAQDIEVVRHYDERLPRVPSDPLLLHQAFLNIVMNAEQAIAAAGRPARIEIATRHDPEAKRVIVTVRDTGTGIPADVLSHIFEPFYTTKEVGQGTGLGLAIAYGIVQEHGGHIAAVNHPEGGAVFTVELPTSTPGSGA